MKNLDQLFIGLITLFIIYLIDIIYKKLRG